MKTRELEQQFNTIVNSLLSPKPIDPGVIQEYVRQYAENAGIPYSLARQAVILKAKDILIKKVNGVLSSQD